MSDRALLSRYLERGFAPVPVPSGRKGAVIPGWPDYRAGPADLAAFDGMNVGLLLGAPSGGLVDVDLDCPEALAAAPHLLPPTAMVSGREGAPRSHRWYVCKDAPRKASTAFADPTHSGDSSRGMLVELRSTGGQTVAPPSVHPSGEGVAWDQFGEPTEVGHAELFRAVSGVAAAALLARHWPGKGRRQDAFLAVAGGLARAGWGVEEAESFVRALADATGDEEASGRVNTVRRTFEKVRTGDQATGWKTLAELVGEPVVGLARRWLGCPPAPRLVPPVPAVPRYRPAAAYEPFPVRHLPQPWGDYCTEVGRLLKCDAAFAALPALGVIASAIGMTRKIDLGGDWHEPAVIWACVVAESGGKKSPAADYILNLVEDRQAKLFAEYRAEAEEWNSLYGGKRGKGSGDGPECAPPRPTAKRVLVADVTIEKLTTLLQENPRGFALHRDEYAGWLGSFRRYKGEGAGSDEANWLSMHRGGSVSYDRKTGSHLTVFVRHACVSVVGGTQPGVLTGLLHKGLLDSGLAPRILWAMPPRTLKEYVRGGIGDALKADVRRSLESLWALKPDLDANGDAAPVTVELTPPALDRWEGFVNEWGRKTFEATGNRASVLTKLESYAARLALLHHCVTHTLNGGEARGPVGLESVEAGIGMGEWFACEAVRVYDLLDEPAAEAELRHLAESAGRLALRHGGLVTVQQWQQAGGRKYRTADDARAALQALVDCGAGAWAERAPGKNGQVREPAYRPGHTPYESYESGEAGDGNPGGGADDSPGRGGNSPAAGAGSTGPNATNRSDSAPAGESGIPDSYDSYGVCAGREAEGAAPIPAADRGAAEETRSTPPDYTLVTDAEQFLEVGRAVSRSRTVGLDTETTGLDPRADRLRLISLATAEGVFLIDCFALDTSPLWPALASVELAGHNLAFDLQFLARLGFAPGALFDSMLASQLLEAGDRAARHSLKEVVSRHLGLDVDKTPQRADWSGPLTAAMLDYAAADATLPVELRGAMLPKIEAAKLGAALALEMAALPAVAWASGEGVAFDRAAWQTLTSAATAEAARLRAELDSMIPGAADLYGNGGRNWDSPAQVKAAFASVGVILDSADDDALAGVNHPAAAVLRDYRGAAKLVGTYGESWLRHANPDGRVYCRWRQLGTMTGRMSGAEPNLQQLPRDARYRKCFAAPPGRVLVKADYSQIELRIAAKLSGDDAMISVYGRGDDLHALTAMKVLGKSSVTKADRQTAKAVNFGLLFGAGAKTLAAYAKSSYGVAMSVEQAAEYRRAFFAIYRGLKAWHDRAGATKDRTVETRTTPHGRRRAGVSSFTEKLNSPVQGAAADGLKRALTLLWETRAECPTAVPVLFVHDEVVIEVDEGDAEAGKAWLVKCMTDGMAAICDPVPVEVEATVARTWAGD